MTLAVAIRFPIGRLGAFNREGGLGLEEGIVLATDSRISGIRDGHVLTDLGRKLFRIANDAALVYAGDTQAAQAAIRDLRMYFRRRAVGAPREATPQVVRILRAAYHREQVERVAGRRERMLPLNVLVGVCFPKVGTPAILFMGSQQNFEPYLIKGTDLAAIGSMSEAKKFEAKLHELDTEQWNGNAQLSLEPEAWHIIAVAAFRLVLEREDLSPGVGGPIQTAFVCRRGVFENEFGYVGPEGNPLDAASWKTVTVPAERTLQLGRPNRRGVASLV